MLRPDPGTGAMRVAFIMQAMLKELGASDRALAFCETAIQMSAYELGLDGRVEEIRLEPRMQAALASAVELLQSESGLDDAEDTADNTTFMGGSNADEIIEELRKSRSATDEDDDNDADDN